MKNTNERIILKTGGIMHIKLNHSGSHSLFVEVSEDEGYYVAKNITRTIDGIHKQPVRLKEVKRSKTYEGLFRKLYEAELEERG